VLNAVAIVAFPASWLTIWGLLHTPLARRLVAHPSLDRWHSSSTPIFGGVGIFAGLTAGLWLAIAVGACDPSRELLGVFAGVTLLFLAGLADDLWHLNPIAKLSLQLLAGAIVLATGTTVQLVHNDILAGAIAMFWLIGMTNAFNLLDNMDGLAASLAAIAFGFFAIDAVTVHPSDAVLAFALAGGLACGGFLPFNLRVNGKALVFMGDSGSQALGFALAGLGLSSSWKVAGTTVATLILPILVLAVPILDTTLVTVVRLLEGRPVFQGGRDHSSHRLVRFGLSEKRAVALLALVAIGLGATSLTYNVLDDRRLTVVGVLVTFVLLIQFASFLADIERQPAPETAPGLFESFRAHWLRLVEVVVDFVLISATFAAAYAITFGWPGTQNQRHLATITLPILLAARYLAFIPFGLYRPIWRYARGRDLLAIAGAVAASELATALFMSATQPLSDFHLSIFVVDGILALVVIGASRAGEHALASGLGTVRDRAGRRTLVVGAGGTGRALVRELRDAAGERVVGFLDDDPRLRRRRVEGVRVLGPVDELPRLLERMRLDIVLVTIPDAPGPRLAAIEKACAEAKVECRPVRREIDLDPRVILGSTL
jgi:UDP-GlcNAc:undecaprenyl-phosphate/decaprenyl-phosphate GlcNAc-1-phosphate transferase